MIRALVISIVFFSTVIFAETNIVECIIANDYRGLEKLLDDGINPNMYSKIDYYNRPYFPFTANNGPIIAIAAFFSDAQTLSILLEHLANPNVPADSGETPIAFAVMSCVYTPTYCEEKIILLLQYNANPFIKDKNGGSAASSANNEYKKNVSDKIRMYFKNASKLLK